MRNMRFALAILITGFLACLWVVASMVLARAQESWWQTDDVRRCCGEADAVYADDWKPNPDGTITATVTAPGPRTPWAPIGKTYIVPRESIITEPGNPLGRALLFITRSGNLYCFAKGAEG